METLPLYIPLIFGATVILTAYFLFKASRYSLPVLILLALWATAQSALAIADFYQHADTMTSRFPLSVLPMLGLILALFLSRRGRAFIDGLDLPVLTLLHVVRIPVELVLFWLFLHHRVPEAMTFQGRNFDVLSGVSAPLIYYFGFLRRKLSHSVLIVWNLICLGLLLNIVSTAMLALPERFRQFGFEQPNIGLGAFPFILLPALVVPLVLFATLASLRQLLRQQADALLK